MWSSVSATTTGERRRRWNRALAPVSASDNCRGRVDRRRSRRQRVRRGNWCYRRRARQTSRPACEGPVGRIAGTGPVADHSGRWLRSGGHSGRSGIRRWARWDHYRNAQCLMPNVRCLMPNGVCRAPASPKPRAKAGVLQFAFGQRAEGSPEAERRRSGPAASQPRGRLPRDGRKQKWAASSAGRAPRSQRGGREFEPPAVHQHINAARAPGCCGVCRFRPPLSAPVADEPHARRVSHPVA